MNNNTTDIPGSKKQVVFQLFVAGNEPYSRRAEVNLKTFCESRLKGDYEIIILDVLESFTVAIEKRIYLTPALIKVSPEPAVTIFGDLSDTTQLVELLAMEEQT